MKKLFVISPNITSDNSFWRCLGPLSYMKKSMAGEIDLIIYRGGEINWSTLSEIDYIFLHRPSRQEDVHLMQLAYRMNIPVWVDYDDWVFDLPSWNPNKKHYSYYLTQLNIMHCISCADLITVSTEPLAEKFKKIDEITYKVFTLPNAYRSDLFPYSSTYLEKSKDSPIYWRGSNTHEGDILSILDGLKTIDNEKIHFFGDPGWLSLSQLKPESYIHHGTFDILQYNRMIYDLKPKAVIVPLHDNFFNRCKSNIAWMESIHAGALCIAPNFPEWNLPGVISYEANNSTSFKLAIEELKYLDEPKFKETISTAKHHLMKHYSIENVIRDRIYAFNTILEGKTNKKNPFDSSIGKELLDKVLS